MNDLSITESLHNNETFCFFVTEASTAPTSLTQQTQNICTTSAQRLRHCTNVLCLLGTQLHLYKLCTFLHTGVFVQKWQWIADPARKSTLTSWKEWNPRTSHSRDSRAAADGDGCRCSGQSSLKYRGLPDVARLRVCIPAIRFARIPRLHRQELIELPAWGRRTAILISLAPYTAQKLLPKLNSSVSVRRVTAPDLER